MMRRWTIGALTLLLALSVAGWIFYMPPAALQTLKPVPAHAQIIYRSAMPDLSVLKQLHDSNGWKAAGRFSQTLEKSPLTLAAVPLGGRDRRDTWIAVSAVGPRAVFLHWKLRFSPPEGVKPIRSYGSWPIWQYSDPSLPPWVRVRFSIAEGLLICSISDDSHDIYYLLDTLDGRRPSAEQKEPR
ncbi:MAG: hypothetical protein HOO88_01185 [Kiritimatiellaceae bacterium]|nr:hypothetical protein [Kiritimatiellaceae bacterium]